MMPGSGLAPSNDEGNKRHKYMKFQGLQGESGLAHQAFYTTRRAFL